MSKFTHLDKLFPTTGITPEQEARLAKTYSPLNDALGALQDLETKTAKEIDRLRTDLRPAAAREALLPSIRKVEALLKDQEKNIAASTALLSKETRLKAFPENTKPKTDIEKLSDIIIQKEIRDFLNSHESSMEKITLINEQLAAGNESYLLAIEADPCKRTIPPEHVTSMRDAFDIEVVKREAPEELKQLQQHESDAKDHAFRVWNIQRKLKEKRTGLGEDENSLINKTFEKKKAFMEAHGEKKYYEELNL